MAAIRWQQCIDAILSIVIVHGGIDPILSIHNGKWFPLKFSLQGNFYEFEYSIILKFGAKLMSIGVQIWCKKEEAQDIYEKLKQVSSVIKN